MDLWRMVFDEVARVPHPNANVDAVLVETNGGATTSFGYEVFIFPRGQKPRRSDHAVVSLYGAGRSDHAYGANLRWAPNDTLVVEYLDAQHADWLNGTCGKRSCNQYRDEIWRKRSDRASWRDALQSRTSPLTIALSNKALQLTAR
jgi:hypothetical protein